MGYKINEGETGIKILFPVFLKFIKVNINDSQFDIKPIYLLSENELKRLKNKKDVFKRMFENYRCIKASLDNLNGYDDFYYEDVETREKHYDDNENYYHINEEWEEYFSDYLLKNMPEEYYQYIVDYEISKPIVKVNIKM